jgi:uncharacterized surface protein with fasciclin (FAS1) repeats
MKIFNYLLILFIVFFNSCKDVWEDHISLNKDVSDKSIVEFIENNPNLSEFLAYLKKSGLDKELSSSKLYTIWVPDNNAMASVDAAILNDSTKLHLFVANHFCLSEYALQGEKLEKLVKAFNGKIIRFNNNDSTVNGVSISAGDIFTKNGIIHILKQPLSPKLNIWEYIESVTESNKHIAYLRSLSGSKFEPNPDYQTGFEPGTGKPVYDTAKCMVWYNSFFEKVADISAEDSVYTFFIVTDQIYDSEYEKFKKYFWVTNGTTSADSAMVKYKITKDYVFRGLYKQPGTPDSLFSLSGVKVPFNSSATLMYEASNGYIYNVTSCDISLKEKIPVIYVEGETADKYLLPTISVSGSNKRYRVGARGDFDFILDNHGQAAAEYSDGTYNPNAGGFALLVKEVASVKYRISWMAVNDFRGGLRNPDTARVLRQKLAFSQIERMIGNQPKWAPVSLVTPLYDTITNKSYASATEKVLTNWTFSRMREDIYFQILAGGTGMSVVLDYLKLEPIFE